MKQCCMCGVTDVEIKLFKYKHKHFDIIDYFCEEHIPYSCGEMRYVPTEKEIEDSKIRNITCFKVPIEMLSAKEITPETKSFLIGKCETKTIYLDKPTSRFEIEHGLCDEFEKYNRKSNNN